MSSFVKGVAATVIAALIVGVVGATWADIKKLPLHEARIDANVIAINTNTKDISKLQDNSEVIGIINEMNKNIDTLRENSKWLEYLAKEALKNQNQSPVVR